MTWVEVLSVARSGVGVRPSRSFPRSTSRGKGVRRTRRTRAASTHQTDWWGRLIKRRTTLALILIVAGGAIPPQDYDELYADGVAAIFGPCTAISESAEKIPRLACPPRRRQRRDDRQANGKGRAEIGKLTMAASLSRLVSDRSRARMESNWGEGSKMRLPAISLDQLAPCLWSTGR